MSAREIPGEVVEFSPEAAEAIRRRGPLPPVPDDCYPPDAVPLREDCDPLAAKAVQAADPGPSGSELAALNHPMTDVERDNFGRGVAANAERLARMTAADIDRKLDDLEDDRG